MNFGPRGPVGKGPDLYFNAGLVDPLYYLKGPITVPNFGRLAYSCVHVCVESGI